MGHDLLHTAQMMFGVRYRCFGKLRVYYKSYCTASSMETVMQGESEARNKRQAITFFNPTVVLSASGLFPASSGRLVIYTHL